MALLPRTVMSRYGIEWESQPGIRQCQGKPGWGQFKETRLQVTPNTDFIETPVEFPGVGQTATISGHQITQTQSVITYSPQYHRTQQFLIHPTTILRREWKLRKTECLSSETM